MTRLFSLFLFSLISVLLCNCAPGRAMPAGSPLLRAHTTQAGTLNSSGCAIQTVRGPLKDALAQLLTSTPTCPSDVFEFKALLAQRGAKVQATMVANRGYHNGGEGSFSLFETVTGPIQQVDFNLLPGSLFFGHFTGADGERLINLQSPERGNLMIELIAWDPAKRSYNFYELIGNGTIGEWFYRGDSTDIQTDLSSLHRQANPTRPAFGRTLRCSGCHLSGGPIMKELAEPHNDWWRVKRPLPLTQQPDNRLTAMISKVEDASLLANHVRAGIERLEAARAPLSQDLQASLRPLFCPQEVNFESDQSPLDQLSNQRAAMQVPSAQLVDPRLSAAESLSAAPSAYISALQALGSQFPEIQRPDGDHAWLAPVKAFADQQQIATLVRQGLIDEEFVLDVLSIDFTRPVVSPVRCGLLRQLPRTATPDWRQQFMTNLNTSNQPAARTLSANLQTLNGAQHQAQARRFLANCRTRLQTPEGVRELLTWQGLSRQAIARSEISANPLGQILEPGFRVIFPVLQLPGGELRLDENCQLAGS